MQINLLPEFEKSLKRLIKKYPSLKNEVPSLILLLAARPDSGISIGNNCYKIRLKIKSKSEGKSGGGRVITYLRLNKNTLYLLYIYDKSEMQNISDQFLKELIKSIIQ